jgi:putative DNA primase/helicase
VKNGVLDLRTGELREARREDLLTKQCAVEFDASARCPEWEKFLARILPDPAVRGFVQRALGYALTGDTREQCFFLLHGTGANGKSTLLNAVKALLGDYAQQSPACAFMAQRQPNGGAATPEIARLRGARFVSSIETEDGQRLAEELVKTLTGQDTVTARHLYSEHFEFQPAFKLWLAANHRPTIRGDDYAIWRRIRLVPFAVQIPEHERDKELPETLLAEAAGILAWLVRGCLSWQRDGLGEPEAVRTATQEYRDEQDIIAEFLDDACVLEPQASETAGRLYGAYRQWAESAGHRGVMTKTKFGRRLTDSERGIERVKGTATKTYKGVRLREWSA